MNILANAENNIDFVVILIMFGLVLVPLYFLVKTLTIEKRFKKDLETFQREMLILENYRRRHKGTAEETAEERAGETVEEIDKDKMPIIKKSQKKITRFDLIILD